MLACLVETDAPFAGKRLLGLTLLERAALAAQAAGATELWCEPPALHALRALRADGRLELRVVEAKPVAEALILRADTLYEPTSLHAFAPGRRVAEGLHVHDAATLAAARRRLLAALVKPSDGPVSRHLNRHLSRLITRVVLPLGTTPNQMTVLVALAGAAAASFAAQPGYRAQLVGGALFQLHSVLDGCDGELARLTHRFGKHGALLDSLVDDASNLAFFFALSLGVARALGAPWPLVTGALTVVGYLGVAFIQYRVVLRTTGKGEKTAFWTTTGADADTGVQSRRAPLMRALHALGRRDVFALVILLALLLGLAPSVVVVLPAMALGALATSLARARGAPKSAVL
jgi:CDP-L-myo-inositol myo-inositolphosphotransferase